MNRLSMDQPGMDQPGLGQPSLGQLRRLALVTDAEAALMVHPDTLADLAAQVTATSAGPDRPVPTRSRGVRRRWLVGIPVAAGLAAAVLIATALGRPGERVGPVHIGPAPAQAQALSFARHHGYITVRVRDPLASPSRYRAEFARRHLDITLRLVPASPSIVGTLVYFDEPASGGITPITARGVCHPASGAATCPVGVRISDGFRGRADVVFGRAARPGEKYDSTASAFAPGEALHGMSIQGLTVTQVLAALHRRHVTAATFNYFRRGAGVLRHHVPGGWYVYDAAPWAPRQVMLSVGPTRTQPVAGPPAGGNQPSASPSPAG